MLVWDRCVRQVDEHTLVVARARNADQRADCLDVAAGFADEAADVVVGELHLDGNGAAATLERLDQNFLRLLGQRLRDILDERAIVDAGAAWRRPVAAKPAAAVEAAAATTATVEAAARPKVTPRGSTSLLFAQGFPPASTGCVQPRSAVRPAAATSSLCPRRSWPGPVRSSGRSTQGAR